MPATGVYLVNSRSSASCAAAFTAPGVGKSGSPAPKSITSIPSRRSRSTVAVTFIVGELAMRDVRSASFMVLPRPALAGCDISNFLAQTLLDEIGDEPVDAAA